MKASRVIVLTATSLLIGFIAAHWCVAQSTSGTEPTTDSYIGLHQLESFVGYLQDTKQTNVLRRFNDYANATLVSRSSADLGINLHILYDLRSGRTNEAIRLLETQMKSDVVSFAGSYQELPAKLRENISLKAFKEAQDYWMKYPAKSGQPGSDQILADAFKLLNDKADH